MKEEWNHPRRETHYAIVDIYDLVTYARSPGYYNACGGYNPFSGREAASLIRFFFLSSFFLLIFQDSDFI